MCKFCEDYKNQKQIDREVKKLFPNCYHKLKLNICDYVYVEGRDYRRSTPSSLSFGKYDINYCPVCGKKLNRKKVIK